MSSFTFDLAWGLWAFIEGALALIRTDTHSNYWKELISRMILLLIGFLITISGVILAGYLDSVVKGVVGEAIGVILGVMISGVGIVLTTYQGMKIGSSFATHSD